jgi:hypothetical protein
VIDFTFFFELDKKEVDLCIDGVLHLIMFNLNHTTMTSFNDIFIGQINKMHAYQALDILATNEIEFSVDYHELHPEFLRIYVNDQNYDYLKNQGLLRKLDATEMIVEF